MGRKWEKVGKKGKKIEEFENLCPLPFNLNVFYVFCFCVVLLKNSGGRKGKKVWTYQHFFIKILFSGGLYIL